MKLRDLPLWICVRWQIWCDDLLRELREAGWIR
jgi:hypothetical protein